MFGVFNWHCDQDFDPRRNTGHMQSCSDKKQKEKCLANELMHTQQRPKKEGNHVAERLPQIKKERKEHTHVRDRRRKKDMYTYMHAYSSKFKRKRQK